MYSKSAFPPLPREFSGRWNHKRYSVIRPLGQGANGAVYLATQAGRKLAVKIGTDPLDLLMEVNMLKSVQQVRDVKIGPLLCDVDDLLIDGKPCTFYSMEYLEGERLDRYAGRVGREWVPVLAVQLLTRLEILHAQGWVFGDLKPENVIVTHGDKQVRLVDFGGVTKKGNAVRQFTEEYDRGGWQAGDRRAEASYDLFSLAVITIRLMTPDEQWKKFTREGRTVARLCDIIRENDGLYPYRMPLLKALQGIYKDAAAMKRDMVTAIRLRSSSGRKKERGSAAGMVLGGLFVASLLTLAGTLYCFWF
ncbi:serine/threonine protein kinase [Brevibacillus sp. SYP-B805]|uniref:serine/threonine protein kinase n=1 Tax=Brevibacillus sp. SYP-B805 TaxID=1578199 RepID=UPI0019D19762|nr:serine/threonine protein kinase [Brevibacillus sp. SYP-B805]